MSGRERGTVLRVRPGGVDLRMAPGEGCAECGACAKAGGGMLLEGVPAPLGLAPGDVVEVSVSPGARSRARILVFVFPVAALLLGYMAGFLLGSLVSASRDAIGAVSALTCGAGALYGVGRLESRAAVQGRASVHVHAIIAQANRPRIGAGSDGTPPGEEDQTRE